MVLLLELARGIAALWVFFFHVKPIFEASSPLIYALSAYGSLGVPMFFVISGYVITYSAESNLENKKSPFTFLKSRFLRIYPTFWASVVVVLVVPYVIELISSLKSGSYTAPDNIVLSYSFGEWANFLLLSKIFWATSNDLQAEFNAINAVYWTLAIEFQFYLIVFFALLFKCYYKYVIGAVSIFSIMAIIFGLKLNDGLFINYWPSFLVGVVLAYLHRNGIWINFFIKNMASQLVALFAAAMLIICSVVFDQYRIFFAASFGVFLWVISDIENVLNKVMWDKNLLTYWLLKPWLVLGAMSYSVYLLHGKIYQLPNMFVRQMVDPDSVIFGMLTIVATLGICYLFYCFIESRFLSRNYKQMQDGLLKNNQA